MATILGRDAIAQVAYSDCSAGGVYCGQTVHDRHIVCIEVE